MHGSKPPKAICGAILPGTVLGDAFSEGRQHLYVLGTNEVFVFNISTIGTTQAPGSPFAVASAEHLVVLSKYVHRTFFLFAQKCPETFRASLSTIGDPARTLC